MSQHAFRFETAPRGRRAAEAGRDGSRPTGGAAIRIVHHAVPGRIRLAVVGLKGAPERAQRLQSLAATWPGVRRASASPATGNLLLEFDPRHWTAEQIAARVQAAVHPAAGGEPADRRGRANGRRQTAELDERVPGAALLSAEARPAGSNSEPASLPAELLAVLEEAPVPPPPPPRTRAMEAALGSAALLGAGALLLAVRAHGHKLIIDQAPLALAQEVHSPRLTAFMLGASRLAEPAVLWPVTLGAALIGVGRQRPGDFPWLAPVAVGGGVTVISLLKALLRRARPAAFEHLAPARGYSLPSGHAFLAACLYGLLAHHGVRWLRARQPDDRRAAAALLTLSVTAILLVGVSRVYLGVHYPTDVIAGYALALLWLFFLAAINDRPRPAMVR